MGGVPLSTGLEVASSLDCSDSLSDFPVIIFVFAVIFINDLPDVIISLLGNHDDDIYSHVFILALMVNLMSSSLSL